MEGRKKNAYKILVGKPYGKGTIGNPRCHWMDNIELDLGVVGWCGVDWIDLDRDWWRFLVNAIMNL
jgi:hypothetical protein